MLRAVRRPRNRTCTVATRASIVGSSSRHRPVYVAIVSLIAVARVTWVEAF
jgi:hypothetical protein